MTAYLVKTWSRRPLTVRRRVAPPPTGTTVVSVSATAMVQAKSFGPAQFITSQVGRAMAQARVRAPGGVAPVGRAMAQAKVRAPGGVAPVGRAMAQAKATVSTQIGAPSRAMAQAKARAPGGVVGSSRAMAQAKARAPGGMSAVGRVKVQITVRGQPLIGITGTATFMARAPGIGFAVRIVPSPKLPLFLLSDDTGSSSWPGRS